MNAASARCAFSFFVVLSGAARAQSVDAATGSSSLAVFLQVLFGLALVLGAFALVAMLMRRYLPMQRSAGGALRVVGGIMVGPRERVVLVEIAETWLVLGVANGQVRTLHTMPRNELTVETATKSQPAFADWLARTLRRQGGERP